MGERQERMLAFQVLLFLRFQSGNQKTRAKQRARNGKWVKGPGLAFVNAIRNGLPKLEMIAEDLGYMTQEVMDLRDASGYPGMKVLQFAFDPKEPSDYLPHTYTRNTVCYTGTHDNMTMSSQGLG